MFASVNTLQQPAGEPLTLEEAKSACRVTADQTADDDFLADKIRQSRGYIEATLAIALVSRTVLVTFDRFPQSYVADGFALQYEPLWDSRIPSTDRARQSIIDRLSMRWPISPLQWLDWIKYTDAAGDLQTVDPTTYRVDYTNTPARIMPAFGSAWPIGLLQSQSVKIQAVVGYGPVTSIAAAISAGSQTVTPASMYGIYAQNLTTDPFYAGTVLAIDSGTNRELVNVTAATGSTFTATFARAHGTNASVLGGFPEMARGRMKLQIAHWYQNREAVAGSMSVMPLAEEAMHWAMWDGELR